MSLQQLITDIRNKRYVQDTIEEGGGILLNNPELLKQLDSDINTIILREAARSKIFLVKFIDLYITFGESVINPLELALAKGNVQLVESLLRSGQKLEDLGWTGYFHPACYIFMNKNKSTRVEMVKLLRDLDYLGFKNDNGRNFLHELSASENNDSIEIAEILISAGVSPNEPDNEGLTPLHVAIQSMDTGVEFVKFLLKNGADVNQVNERDQTSPFLTAVKNYDDRKIDVLLSYGATDVNAASPMEDEDSYLPGATALHIACHFKNEKTILSLIRKGANVCAEAKDGLTPFYFLRTRAEIYPESYKRCVIIMVKELSKLSFENLPVPQLDLNRIREDSKAKEHFEKCNVELGKMADTKLHRCHSYYSLLKKSLSVQKFAVLVKNKYIVSAFKENLKQFSYFKNDLLDIFEEAVKLKDQVEMAEKRITDIFGNYLPDVVKRKLAKNLTAEHLPTE